MYANLAKKIEKHLSYQEIFIIDSSPIDVHYIKYITFIHFTFYLIQSVKFNLISGPDNDNKILFFIVSFNRKTLSAYLFCGLLKPTYW